MRKKLPLLAMLAMVACTLVAPAAGASTEPSWRDPAPRLADTGCGQSTWSQLNANGYPLPMTFDGWGDCPSSRSALWWARWSYPDYPINLVPADSPEPAFQLIWVTNADAPKTPLIDSKPGMVRNQVRRAVSAIAASNNRGVVTAADAERTSAPRIVSFLGTGADGRPQVQPLFARATVPQAVLRREPYQNWVNPATGELEQGLWPYLEDHGYPARANRRYITITDYAGVWNQLGGATVVPCSGNGYGPADTQPGPQNCNNKGGTWMTISLAGNAGRDLGPEQTLSFGEKLAHELAHSMGGVLPDSPHYNPDHPLHPSDCADLLCLNSYDQPGQHYTACGGSKSDTFRAFTNGIFSSPNTSRWAYRLDCGRDDYFALDLVDGHVVERDWAESRWAGENNQFFWGGERPDAPLAPFSNDRYKIAPECTYNPAGWCPPGVQRAAG